MIEVEQLLGGTWGAGSAAGEFITTNPADGTPVSRAPVASAEDVAAAVKSARAATAGWARTPAAERAAALRRAADAVAEQAGRLAEITTCEMGRPIGSARASVEAGIGALRQWAELGPVHRGRSLAGSPEALDLMVYGPRGVVAAITPWNDPVAVSCGLLGAALVTGNTVIYKPSERTPATGCALIRLLAPHFPEGVLSMLTGDGRVGAELAGADVDLVAHVGSSATGRSIAAACAATGARPLLENGGNDPLIVDAGVDPVWAARQAATGAFANAGRLCVAVERIYVHRELAGQFVDALVAEATRLRIGPGCDARTQLGPLVDSRLRDAVHEQVTAAVRAGATLRHGGQVPPGPGTFYPPTVLTDCTDDMAVVREETFGPVAPVVMVDSFDEALSRAADSRNGLAATVLTRSMSVAQRALRELPVGMVKVNAVCGGAPGGAARPRRDGADGLGYGPELLDELTVTKVVHLTAPAGGW